MAIHPTGDAGEGTVVLICWCGGAMHKLTRDERLLLSSVVGCVCFLQRGDVLQGQIYTRLRCAE